LEMPRPIRKAAAKKALDTEHKPTLKKSIIDKENISTAIKKSTRNSIRTKTVETRQTVNTTRKRLLKDAEESKLLESSPKRLHIVQETNSIGSPGVSPQYGRRTSALYGRASLTPVSQRRGVGEGLVVFDELIDGISPIKHGRPKEPETELRLSDQETESVGLPLPQDILSEKKMDKPTESVDERSGPRTRSKTKPEYSQNQQLPKIASEESQSECSDSEDFDLDAFMARSGRKSAESATRNKRRDSKLAANMATGKVTVMDLVDKDGAASELPKRHRTQLQNGIGPAAAAAAAAATSGTRRNGSTAKKTRTKKTTKNIDKSFDSNNRTPDNKRTLGNKQQKNRSRLTSNSQRGKAQLFALGKKNTDTADIWCANNDVAKYFDDIDGFQLVEEQV
ncbi:hypothetical protein COEREDRAFT_83585, partial [Coemansia reversa NRRL 1564]